MSNKSIQIWGICSLFSLLLAASPSMQGQEGYNSLSSNTSGTSTPSPAFIDATPFYTGDVCAAINTILLSSNYTTNFPDGAVIDARGILVNSSGGLPLTCAGNPFSSVTKPSTILLPAVSIAIGQTWEVPGNTRIIGEGPTATQLWVSASGFTGTTMIEMCPGSTACTGISLEHLRIQAADDTGTNYAVDGIDNNFAQDGSYIDDVVIYSIGATSSTSSITNDCNSGSGPIIGLCVSKNASHSGPYTNVDITGNLSCNSGTCVNTACVKIQSQIRGLHGLTCTTGKSSSIQWPAAAIYLDSYNVSIEDVHIEGYKDGILIGDNIDGEGGTAQGDVLANVTGVFGSGPVQNTIHICNLNSVVAPCLSTSMTVSDLTILNAMSLGNGNSLTPDTIEDDLFGETINKLSSPVTYVGLYAIGEQITAGVYPRFTTSGGPNTYNTTTGGTSSNAVTPTWGFGGSG